MPVTDSILELNDVQSSYTLGGKSHAVVKGVSLKVRKGDFIAITGTSGSGKSTLLYLMACLKSPDSGTIKVFGESLQRPDREIAALRNNSFGFVFQDFHLIGQLNILDNVLLPTQYSRQESKKDYKERALRLIERLGLSHVISHKPNQLSGGQQQRVAIARALIQNPDIIFADEPTGALDSQSTKEVMEILNELNEDGHTIIIVTHDRDLAGECPRQIILKDGKLEEDNKVEELPPGDEKVTPFRKASLHNSLWSMIALSFSNLRQNKARTFLTMFGLCVGIMSVLILVSIGHYTEDKVLQGYENLGVNKLAVRGHPDWRKRTREDGGITYNSFSYEQDLSPLTTIFPDIKRLSPILRSWDGEVHYGGQQVDKISILGATPDYLEIEGRQAVLGENLNHHHVLRNQGVCNIGISIVSEIFRNTSPIGQIVNIKMREKTLTCKVIGVLNSRTSNNDWFDPNKVVVLPYTYFQSYADSWRSKIHRFVLEAFPGRDVERLSDGLKAFFVGKYGETIRFRASRDDLLASNLKKFMFLFNVLMICIAAVTLTVGGTGVTNMMLIAIAERFHEIGVRKAYGATNKNVMRQFLTEGILIAFVSGMIGVVLGFGLYESFLYMVSQVTRKVEFAWIIYPDAIILSYVAIFLVGVLASLVPAIKASRLDVIEALRSR